VPQFVAAVRSALSALKTRCLDAASDGGRSAPKPRLSVSAVLRDAGLGRSQLYAKYPFLLREILEATREVERAQKERHWAKAKTRAELESTVRELKAEMVRRVATVASQQLSQLKEKVEPQVRERDRLFAENAELREKLAQAQHTHSIQTAMIRKLMAANNVSGKR
jgi:regulator of replication initiation timing